MRLRRRVQLLLVVAFVLLAANFAVDVRLQLERDEVAHLVDDHLEPARLKVSALLTALVDQETAQRGYVITGQERFLAPFEQGGAVADAALAGLRRDLVDYPELQAAVQRAISRVSAWRQLGAQFEIEAKRAGRDEEAQTLVATGTAQELFDRARAEIESLRIGIADELMEQEDRLDRFERALNQLRLVAAAGGLAMVVAAAVLLRRWVTRPLDELRGAVRSVAGGHLETRVATSGPLELQELGADVDAMRRRILDEVDDASRAREALARRGMVVLSVREDLAPAALRGPSGIRLASHFLPAEGVVAGDWFDVVHLDDDRAVVALMDVSGHGGGSAVFALRTKHLTLAALRSGLRPGEAFAWLAGQLGETDERFLTGVLIEIDGASGDVRYASAGHPPLVVRDGTGVRLLGPTGPLVGPLPGRWSTVETSLGDNGLVLAYSDGLVEARDASGEEFGVDRLVAVVADVPPEPEHVVQRFRDEFHEFRPVSRPDDTSLIVLAREPTAVRSAEPARDRDPVSGQA